jgi:hypothetical protein
MQPERAVLSFLQACRSSKLSLHDLYNLRIFTFCFLCVLCVFVVKFFSVV